MAKRLDELGETLQCQRLGDLFGASMDVIEKPDRLLYHYTTADSFMGILESGLWATSIRHLNDPSEWLYGLIVARRVQEELLRDAPALSVSREWLERLSLADVEEETDVYIIAFSETPDSLPQWRAYGDDGAGIAIGVDADFYCELRAVAPRLLRVEYDLEAQKELIRAGLRAVMDFLERESVPSSSESDRATAMEVALSFVPVWLVTHQIRLKSEAWSHEREWRLAAISHGHNQIAAAVRNKGSRFVPYCPGYRPLLPAGSGMSGVLLREVQLGPRRDWKNDKRFLGRFLNQRGFGGVPIVESGISYR